MIALENLREKLGVPNRGSKAAARTGSIPAR